MVCIFTWIVEERLAFSWQLSGSRVAALGAHFGSALPAIGPEVMQVLSSRPRPVAGVCRGLAALGLSAVRSRLLILVHSYIYFPVSPCSVSASVVSRGRRSLPDAGVPPGEVWRLGPGARRQGELRGKSQPRDQRGHRGARGMRLWDAPGGRRVSRPCGRGASTNPPGGRLRGCAGGSEGPRVASQQPRAPA